MGLLSWLASGSSEGPHWLRRWLVPGPSRDNAKVDEIKRAAAEDVDEVEEDRSYFRPDAPGHIEDDL